MRGKGIGAGPEGEVVDGGAEGVGDVEVEVDVDALGLEGGKEDAQAGQGDGVEGGVRAGGEQDASGVLRVRVRRGVHVVEADEVDAEFAQAAGDAGGVALLGKLPPKARLVPEEADADVVFGAGC